MRKLRRLQSPILAAIFFLPLHVSAASGNSQTPFSDPLFNALLFVIIVLLITIVALGGVLRHLIRSEMFIDKLRTRAANKPTKIMTVALFILVTSSLTAQDNTGTIAPDAAGVQESVIYTMLIVIAAELLVLGLLLRMFRTMLGGSAAAGKPVAEKRKKKKTVLDKINSTVGLEDEKEIMLEHEYDGIRELDNVLPPWWKYGFYLSIVVAVVYMIVYHVADSLPLQKEEYATSLKKAEAEVAAFMKTSANNVDETTVKILSDPADLKAGQDIFIASCSACHGRAGEGGVGPNLTDAYWLHSGSIADIFKSIKYGWPENGMKPWKDDFSPVQIAQLSSFIVSISGTNPPGAKEQQGELYAGEAPTATTVKDSTEQSLTSEKLDLK